MEPPEPCRHGIERLRPGGADERSPSLAAGELPREDLAPFERAILVVAVQPELGGDSLEHRQVRIHVLRSLAEVAPLERADARLLVLEPLLHVLELLPEEGRGAGGLLLAHPDVLGQVEGRQRVRQRGDRFGVPPRVAHGKGNDPPLG